MIVVDASLALRWVLGEAAHSDSDAALTYVGRHSAQVPGNFQSEIAHGLLQAQRHKWISSADVSLALSELFALPLEVHLPDPHVVVATASAYSLSGYDGNYLALALESGLPLATVDASLRKAARSAGALWQPKG